MLMVQRVRLRIRGRVQGVFYRKTTEDIARALGLSGWVRNMTDGSVEAFAIGPREKLEQLISWCADGPPSAQVDSVETLWKTLEELLEDELMEPDSGFKVRGFF